MTRRPLVKIVSFVSVFALAVALPSLAAGAKPGPSASKLSIT